jgi:PTS system nitrogen regulatory IIA component
MDNLPEIMSLSDASAFLGWKEQELMSRYKEGRIAGVKLGDTFCFRTADLLDLRSQQPVISCVPKSKPSILTGVLDPDSIIFLESADKADVLTSLIDILASKPEITSAEELTEGIFKREELMSTGMGLGIGIPHIRIPSVKDIVLAAAVVRNGVPDYETLDSSPVYLVFMIAARPDQHADHLKIVSSLSLKLKNGELRKQLVAADNAENFMELLLGGE